MYLNGTQKEDRPVDLKWRKQYGIICSDIYHKNEEGVKSVEKKIKSYECIF